MPTMTLAKSSLGWAWLGARAYTSFGSRSGWDETVPSAQPRTAFATKQLGRFSPQRDTSQPRGVQQVSTSDRSAHSRATSLGWLACWLGWRTHLMAPACENPTTGSSVSEASRAALPTFRPQLLFSHPLGLVCFLLCFSHWRTGKSAQSFAACWRACADGTRGTSSAREKKREKQ